MKFSKTLLGGIINLGRSCLHEKNSKNVQHPVSSESQKNGGNPTTRPPQQNLPVRPQLKRIDGLKTFQAKEAKNGRVAESEGTSTVVFKGGLLKGIPQKVKCYHQTPRMKIDFEMPPASFDRST